MHFFNGLTQVLICLFFFFSFFETVGFLYLTRAVSNYGFKTGIWTRHNLQNFEDLTYSQFYDGLNVKGSK